jgi:hypothetical protein
MPLVVFGKADLARLRSVTPGAIRAAERRLAKALREADGEALPKSWRLSDLKPLPRLRLRLLVTYGTVLERGIAHISLRYAEGDFGRALSLLLELMRIERLAEDMQQRLLTDLALSVAHRKNGKGAGA